MIAIRQHKKKIENKKMFDEGGYCYTRSQLQNVSIVFLYYVIRETVRTWTLAIKYNFDVHIREQRSFAWPTTSETSLHVSHI